MLRFFGKLIILACLTLAVTVGTGRLLRPIPATRPNADIAFSYDYFREHKSEANTLFIGSSRFLQQVSPRVFDELLAQDYGIQSYNFSTYAFFSPASYTFLKAVLLDKPANLKYILFEFDVKNQPILKNLHTTRFYLGYDYAETKMLLRSLWQEPLSFVAKVTNSYYHLVSFVEKQMSLGSFSLVLQQYLTEQPLSDSARATALVDLGPDRDGFFVSDDVIATYPERTHLVARHQRLVDDPRKLQKRLVETRAAMKLAEENPRPNEAVYSYLAEIERLAKERGVALFFVMTPKRGDEYRTMFSTFYALPEKSRIDLSSPEEYPEFYDLEHSYDSGHLNKKGAVLFTEKLAEEFKQRIEKSSFNVPSHQ